MKRTFAQKLKSKLEYSPIDYPIGILGQNPETLMIEPEKLLRVTLSSQKVMKNLIHTCLNKKLTNLGNTQVNHSVPGFVMVKDFQAKEARQKV